MTAPKNIKQVYTARNPALIGALELAKSLGASPQAILKDIGVPPALVEKVGMRVPSAAIMDSYVSAAIATGRPDFGLLLASVIDHRNTGPIGLLMEQASNFAEAMRFAHRFLHLHNNGWSSVFVKRARGVMLRLDLHTRGKYETHQYIEAVTLTHVRLAKLFLGSTWNPGTIMFKHKPLSKPAVWKRYLGPHVLFEQNANGISFSEEELSRSMAPGEPAVRRQLEAMLHDMELRRKDDLLTRTSELLRVLLPLRRGTIEEVAQALAITPRTLQRRLATRQLKFQSVVAETRVAMAREYIGTGRLSLTQTAPLLGFSEPSALSRFLRQYADLAASDLRKVKTT